MKRSYHTDIAIQFKLGILNANLKREIPSSTLHNWKTKDFSSLVGNEYVTGFEQNLEMINPQVDLVCDGGSENKGMVDAFVNNPHNKIRKLIAQTDIRFSNSMVEAINKRMKYDFLFTTNLLNIEQVIQYLNWAVDQYNKKPHTALFGLTPIEVFHGALPDKDMYKPAMQHAAKMRKEENLNQQCLNCTGNSSMINE